MRARGGGAGLSFGPTSDPLPPFKAVMAWNRRDRGPYYQRMALKGSLWRANHSEECVMEENLCKKNPPHRFLSHHLSSDFLFGQGPDI